MFDILHCKYKHLFHTKDFEEFNLRFDASSVMRATQKRATWLGMSRFDEDTTVVDNGGSYSFNVTMNNIAPTKDHEKIFRLISYFCIFVFFSRVVIRISKNQL